MTNLPQHGYSPNTRSSKGNGLAAVAGIVIPVVAGSAVATQYVANAFGNDPALPGHLAGPIYQPLAFWGWAAGFYSAAPTTFNIGLALFSTTFISSGVAFMIWRGLRYRSARKHAGVHGTARFATPDEIQDAGLLPLPGQDSEGVFCGLYQSSEKALPLYLKHNGPEHVMAIAPTRSGKGVGLIVPTLLTWKHSAFILDMKGENEALTAGWRGTPIAEGGAGNRVLRFEPGAVSGSARWNPLDEIRHRTIYEVADADNMAGILMDAANKDGGKSDPYFQNAGRNLLSAILIYTRYLMEPDAATLADCYTVLTGGDPRPEANGGGQGVQAEVSMDAMRQLWTKMQKFAPPNADKLIEQIARKVRLTGARLVTVADEELSGIIGSAATPLEPYLDPILSQNTAASDFLVSDLMDAEQPVSLYYVLPGTDIERLVPITRLLLITMMRKLAPAMERDDTGNVKAPHKHRLLMMMDEFPILGALDEFQTSMAFLGGYGIKVYLIAQDVPQITRAYGQHESIIGNCHIRIFYTPNRLETAEPLSRTLGKTTVTTEQITETGSRFSTTLSNVSRTYSEVQRDLLTPDELLALPQPVKNHDGSKILEPGAVLVSVAGRRPILAKQSLWFLDPILAERPRIAPPSATAKIAATVTPSAVPAAAFTIE